MHPPTNEEFTSMNYKIVSDSSSNLFYLADVPYTCVPMKVVTSEKEYVDTPELDVPGMVENLKTVTGRTGSSCPNTHEWIESFGGADCVFGITITSKLSGSYSSAVQAGEEYMATHPGAKVCILDSLSAGPELQLVVEKLREYILAGMSFEDIEQSIRAYMNHTHLSFSLKSLANLARNGRVNPAVAKIAGVLGIYLIGKATDGTLDPTHKCRGEKKALKTLAEDLKSAGYCGGKVRIAHCMNPEAAAQFKAALTEQYPNSDIQIDVCKGLCSYYAEIGGLLVGFESVRP